MPDRRRRHRDPGRAARGRRVRVALLPAGTGPRPALRLPRDRPVRPAQRQPVQSEQAAPRPVRQGDRWPDRRPRVPVLLSVRRPGRAQRRRLGGTHDDVRRGQPLLRLGLRPPAAAQLPRERDLRGPRQGPDPAAPGCARAAAWHLRGHGPPRDHRAPHQARDHGDRAHARAPVRQRPAPGRQGAVELLGLQHDRILRAAQRVRGVPDARAAGAGVQVDGQDPARGQHRGHPRRRLQPHRRGQPPRPDPVDARHRQRRVLPARRHRQGPLLRHDRHRELAAHAPPARAAADHGLVAVLGHRDARRRLPVRPGLDPGPSVPRGRPALGVLRHGPAGPGHQPGQAHRGAVGPRRRRLPGRRLPTPVERVERRLPRHRARLLARRAVHARKVREPRHRLLGPVRAHRPQADRLGELHHRARRVHLARPGLLQQQAQRGERRERQRRREPQPVLELRRRGPHGRPDDQRVARPPAAQLPHHAAPLPGCADAGPRRRARPHPAGQQQRVRAGQRARLGELGPQPHPAGAPRLHPPSRAPAPRAPGAPPPPVLRRATRPARRVRAARHRLAQALRRAHAGRGLAAGPRQGGDGLSQR